MTLKYYNPPQEPYLDIIFHDNDILVLNKQSGLLTVPGKGEHLADCLEKRAKDTFPTALTLHRLDMDTSGLIIMGLNKYSHRHLSLQFQNRNVAKEYTALVFGNMERSSGEVDLPLICDWPNRPKQKVDHAIGKPSRTKWHVIERYEDKTLLSLIPLTGRSHQLRVHMDEIGHSILGDRFYASEKIANMSNRLCLHSTKLTIMHPVQKKMMTFKHSITF